jgi:hypothetical protein
VEILIELGDLKELLILKAVVSYSLKFKPHVVAAKSMSPQKRKEVGEPPCFMCGEEPATISNPNFVLDLPPFLGYPLGTTCADLERIGRFDGTITPEGCAILQQQTEVVCGCSNLDEEASSDAGGPPAGVETGGPPAGVGEEVSESFPPCYWCGGTESDTASNPDSVLDLPPFLGYPPGTTCGDLERIGRFDRTISPGGCGIVQGQTAILEQCGCDIGV